MTDAHTRPSGEDSILADIFPLLPTNDSTVVGPGDDCAVIATQAQTVVTTDVLVENRHFRRDWSSGFDIGWRAVMQNAADVAAMGGVTTHLVIAMTVPDDVTSAWLLDCARGFAAAAEPHGMAVVGGDLSSGQELTVSVTAIGHCPGRIVLRSGAQIGDRVVLAGSLGRSAAGYAVLNAGLAEEPYHEVVDVFRRPQPPLEAGPALAAAGATAMLDVSDGLLRDAGRVACASGVRLDLGLVGVADWAYALKVAAKAVQADPMDWVLTGGEDHGLLACMPAGSALPPGVRIIGKVLDARGGPGVLVDGQPQSGEGGWDHFSR